MQSLSHYLIERRLLGSPSYVSVGTSALQQLCGQPRTQAFSAFARLRPCRRHFSDTLSTATTWGARRALSPSTWTRCPSSVGSRRPCLHQSSIPCATRESSRRRASCRRASLPSLPSRCRSIPRRTTSPLVVAPTDRGPSSCAGPSAWTCCNVPSERAKGTFTGEGSVQVARKSQLGACDGAS